MDDMRNTQASLYGKAEPATAKTTMSVREMQHLLCLLFTTTTPRDA